jgi:phage major head subunit gpT-like protein
MDPTSSNLQIYFTGLSTVFQEGYTNTPPWWSQVAMELPSTTELSTYGWMDKLPAARQWIGPRQVNAIATRNRSVVNLDWEDSVGIPRNAFLDDQYGLYTYTSKSMGEAAAKLHDQQLAALMQQNPTAFDGVTFFNSAHPVDIDAGASGPLGSYSNDLTTSALNPTNYGAARAAMRSFIGRDGKPMGSVPSLLAVPPQLEETAKQILTADLIAPSSFANGTQVGSNTNIWKGTASFIVIEELQNQPKVWYMLDNRSAMKPFLVQKRKEPEFVYLVNPNDANVFYNKQFVFGWDSRSAYDVVFPFKAIRCGSGL